MKKKTIYLVLAVLLIVTVLISYFYRWDVSNEILSNETVQISLDSTEISAVKLNNLDFVENDRILIEIEISRRCTRNVLNQRRATYAAIARSYWEKSKKPFVCKYIEVQHSKSPTRREANVSQVYTSTGQSQRHCRAHHGIGIFNPYGYKEYRVEKGQQ